MFSTILLLFLFQITCGKIYLLEGYIGGISGKRYVYERRIAFNDAFRKRFIKHACLETPVGMIAYSM